MIVWYSTKLILLKTLLNLFIIWYDGMITIGWRNGAWKWTLTKTLSKILWYEIISIWNIKRKLASEIWLTILEFDTLWRENPEKAKEFDLKYEDYQKSLNPNDAIVLDSRLSFMCQPKAFNVFLNVEDNEWAKRVFEHQRDDDESSSFEAVLLANQKRHQWQYEAYMKLYKIDLFDTNNYDLVIDTTTLTPEQVVNKVLEWYQARKINR